MPLNITLKSPLLASWQDQYVRLVLPNVAPADPLTLTIDNVSKPFQYTGETTAVGAEVLVKLGFDVNQTRQLTWTPAESSSTDLSHKDIDLTTGAKIGVPERLIEIPAPSVSKASSYEVDGPFAGFAGQVMSSRMSCERAFESASLRQVNDGPLFTEYVLEYRFAERRNYILTLRCFKQDTYVEVSEQFSLGMNAGLSWTINPSRTFDQIISRDSFEGETQPVIEPLAEDRVRDVLCRLQMPVLSEYFIPNNRAWFSFYDSKNEDRGMIGIMGLYGQKWEAPVENMPELFGRDGKVEWTSSLAGGRRYWLLYAGPVEKDYTADRRFVFHRLHAEYNQLRLDEHFDLTCDAVYDESCWNQPGMFAGDDPHKAARERVAQLPCLRKWMDASGKPSSDNLYEATFIYLIEGDATSANAIYEGLIARFEKWVRQFQGWRTAQNDYGKNVIGFSRYLRGMLIGYEILRRDGALTDEQVRILNSYFAFAARRITDEGRWPHDRTWRHPDHPESSRDIYAYGGEHKPDRLVWTNCLPNFQSDPLCALAHLSAIFKDHPDALAWRRKGLDELDRQLDAYCGKSGAWEESINYALYTFAYLVITMRPVKYRWGIDYFNDERVRRFAGWLCRYFGPYDKRFEAYTWPSIGNSSHPAHGGSYMLAYSSELAKDDPLRSDCVAIYQLQEQRLELGEYYATVLAAMAPIPDRKYSVRETGSECMDEVGVSMRMNALKSNETYLFQKIGFAKDHYEGDETAFNWYAKGTPFLMDYGTYTSDVAGAAAHNVIEIPDEDSIRRGYLADHLFTDAINYTRSEVPVVLKLLWGRVRTFAETDDTSAVVREKTPYFYIGDKNPVGPKCWKVRCLLFVKPDYLVVFDRVYGEVPHRYNLHFTGDGLKTEGATVTGRGRYDLDLTAYIQHPKSFDIETGTLVPKYFPQNRSDERFKHAQDYFRLTNHEDGIYRTLLFAQERGRNVSITSVGASGMRVETDDYTDYVFAHNDLIDERTSDIAFSGRSGWIRRSSNGKVSACLTDGDSIEAFGMRFEGVGPWSYDSERAEPIEIHNGPPRVVSISRPGA